MPALADLRVAFPLPPNCSPQPCPFQSLWLEQLLVEVKFWKEKHGRRSCIRLGRQVGETVHYRTHRYACRCFDLQPECGAKTRKTRHQQNVGNNCVGLGRAGNSGSTWATAPRKCWAETVNADLLTGNTGVTIRPGAARGMCTQHLPAWQSPVCELNVPGRPVCIRRMRKPCQEDRRLNDVTRAAAFAPHVAAVS